MARFFEVTVVVEDDTKGTLAESLREAKKTVESFGLKAASVRPVQSRRTTTQNAALWKFYALLADELNKKGLDMRTLIRQEVELSWTPYSVHEYLWKPLLKVLTGKKSTTKMDKTREIHLVYENLNRILIERTKGEITFPMWPSIESLEAVDN